MARGGGYANNYNLFAVAKNRTPKHESISEIRQKYLLARKGRSSGKSPGSAYKSKDIEKPKKIVSVDLSASKTISKPKTSSRKGLDGLKRNLNLLYKTAAEPRYSSKAFQPMSTKASRNAKHLGMSSSKAKSKLISYQKKVTTTKHKPQKSFDFTSSRLQASVESVYS
jgi:hypothetical protein